MTGLQRLVPFLALGALVSLAAPDARASKTYPQTIERALGTPCAPDCTTCHTTPSGGDLTANTPVGISARRAGLECCDNGLLLDVLGTLETNGTDSDMDGTSDIEELRAGTNPNTTEGKLKCYVPKEETGCAVATQPPREPEDAASALAVAVGLGFAYWRRRVARAV